MAEKLTDKTPAERYAEMDREEEIGSTSGQRHDDVLARTLGRERGLAAATGVAWDEPVITSDASDAASSRGPQKQEAVRGGDEFELVRTDVAPEGGTGRTAPTPPNEEINEKKVERHGDVGGRA
jgi:hypothetical protein